MTNMDNNKSIQADIAVFQDAGFRLVDKEAAMALTGNEEFDSHSPDAILVAQNDVAGSALPYAIACMHSGSRNNTFIYAALDKSTSADKISQLERMGGFFYELSSGDHMGYIPVRDTPVAPGEVGNEMGSYEDTLNDLLLMDLQTVKIPLDNEAIGLLPFFTDENSLPSKLTDEQLVSKLASNLGDFTDVMDATDEQKLAMRENNLLRNGITVTESYSGEAPKPSYR